MVLASASTGLWVAIGLLVALKLPLIAALLWLPFRSDSHELLPDDADSAEGDGGAGVVATSDGPPPSPDRGGGGPHSRPPRPRHARRGEHDGDRPAAPERVRVGHHGPLRPSRQD